MNRNGPRMNTGVHNEFLVLCLIELFKTEQSEIVQIYDYQISHTDFHVIYIVNQYSLFDKVVFNITSKVFLKINKYIKYNFASV